MTEPVLFQTMARYNAWMNGKLYAAAATLTDEERKADRGAFFKSIHGTLDHIMLGDRAWMNRLAVKTYPVGPIGQPLFGDFDEMRSSREALDGDIVDWTETLSADWLAEPMTWQSILYGRTLTHPRWGLVMHLFNHSTHHRGQATTLLTQMGRDVGPTDMPIGPIWPD